MLTKSQGNNSVFSSDSEEESEREQSHKNVLGYTAQQRFEAMLRAFSGKCGEIARCMSFSLEHAEAAHAVWIFLRSSRLRCPNNVFFRLRILLFRLFLLMGPQFHARWPACI
jgi:hypothetical protein